MILKKLNLILKETNKNIFNYKINHKNKKIFKTTIIEK